MVHKIKCVLESPGGSLKQIAGQNSQRPRICISNEFTGDSDSSCPGTTLCWEPWSTQEDHLETPTACVCMRSMPKSARLTPKENSPKGWGFLLFLQGAVVKFYCWFWEQFMLKLSSGRKRRNHNSGLKLGNLGFDCTSAPSVPLFTG